LRGIKREARRLSCQLVGGDTTRRREILINITVVGEVEKGRALLRSRARPGDGIFVSGKLGEAELGLKLIRNRRNRAKQRSSLLRKRLSPEPRLGLGQWLVRKRITAAVMDLSDGLSSDLARLCEASGVGARLESSKIPLASEVFLQRFGAADRLRA